MNYNFGYNKTAMSFFYIGIRYGFSFFTYDIDNILVESPYWGESEKLQITGQKSWAHWGELLGGLRVQVYKNFYMGWTVRYRLMFSHKRILILNRGIYRDLERIVPRLDLLIR